MESSEFILKMFAVVNVLLLPLVSLAVRYRRTQRIMRPTLGFLAEYSEYSAAILIVSQFPIKLLERITGNEVQYSSIRYTLIAVLLAMILPYAAELFQKIFRLNLVMESVDPDSGNGSDQEKAEGADHEE